MLLGAVIAMLTLAPARTAKANVEVYYAHSELYHYEITYAPDLDQKRTALPGGGSCYCMPTSAVNWAAYFANHGLPALPPGPGWWESPFFYDPATEAVYLMGWVMLTDPTEGTTGKFGWIGLRAWLGQVGDNFCVIRLYSNCHWSPTVHELNMATMAGAYVIISVGWYYEMGTLIARDSGHAVSLVSGARNGDMWEIGICDPGSDEGDHTIQSPFTIEKYGIEHRFVEPIVPYLENHRWMSKMAGYGGGGKWGYVDGLYYISPLYAVTTFQTAEGVIELCRPMQLYGAATPDIREFLTPQAMAVQSMAIHPDGLHLLYIADNPQPGEPAQFWRLEPVTGASELMDLPMMMDPREVALGRRRDVYILDGDDLVRVNLDTDPPTEVTRITPPAALSAITYDDETDQVVLLAPGSQSILRYPYHFDLPPDVRPITPPIPLGFDTSIRWDVTQGAAWVVSEASSSLFKLTPAAGVPVMISEELTHPVLTGPINAVDCGDNGHLFVSCGGMLHEFELTERGLVLVADPMFPDAEAGDHLCILKSRTNFDPNIHEGPEWFHAPPDTFSDPIDQCEADVNNDDVVDVLDLLAVISAWGPCPGGEFCHEDIDYSGTVDVLDLLEVIASWGPCDPLGACCLGLDCVETNTEDECDVIGGEWYFGEDCNEYQCQFVYCAASSGCGQYISRVQLADMDNESGCDGYINYGNIVGDIAIAGHYPITITLTNGYDGNFGGLWVDWNRDHDFWDEDEEIALSPWWGPGPYTATIIPPFGTLPGQTRMRVRVHREMDWPWPCDDEAYGEVEDYVLNLTQSPYCSVYGECDQYISRVQFGEIDNVSDCAFGWYGYSNFTALATELHIGVPSMLTVTVDYGESGDECAAWIDWNHDLTFDDEGEAIALSGTPGPGPYTAAIIAPPDAVLGETCLRIRSDRDREPLPCGDQSIGETEDYTVIVNEPSP